MTGQIQERSVLSAAHKNHVCQIFNLRRSQRRSCHVKVSSMLFQIHCSTQPGAKDFEKVKRRRLTCCWSAPGSGLAVTMASMPLMPPKPLITSGCWLGMMCRMWNSSVSADADAHCALSRGRPGMRARRTPLVARQYNTANLIQLARL